MGWGALCCWRPGNTMPGEAAGTCLQPSPPPSVLVPRPCSPPPPASPGPPGWPSPCQTSSCSPPCGSLFLPASRQRHVPCAKWLARRPLAARRPPLPLPFLARRSQAHVGAAAPFLPCSQGRVKAPAGGGCLTPAGHPDPVSMATAGPSASLLLHPLHLVPRTPHAGE